MKTLLALLLLSLSASAQELQFWTRSNSSLVALDGASKAADFYFTMQRASNSRVHCSEATGKTRCWGLFVEEDPIARPFVTHGRALAAGYFAGVLALETFTAYELHRHGHRKLAKVVLFLGTADNSIGAIQSH